MLQALRIGRGRGQQGLDPAGRLLGAGCCGPGPGSQQDRSERRSASMAISPLLPRTLLLASLWIGGAALPSALQADPLDGEYLGWEERLEVRAGRVVACSGFAFNASGRDSCDGWSFRRLSSGVVQATRPDQPQPLLFCRAPRPGNRGWTCSAQGWEAQR